MDNELLKEILAFLRELRDNNNREWFNANKSRYQRLKKGFDEFTGVLIDKVALFDPEIKGLEVKDCVYRIYRDVRFSPDKSPYKIHFASFIAARGGRNSIRGGYYIHLQPDGCFLSGGIYCPEPAVLKRLRQDVFDNLDEFKGILNDKDFKKDFSGLDATNSLKRVPAPFPSDFPDGDLLKHKDYTVVSPKPDSYFESGDVLNKVMKVFEKLYPFNRFLNYTIDEMN